MQQLLLHLKNIHPLSAAATEAVEQCFEKIVFAKNAYLLREGQVCRHLYFIEEGCLRGFYNLDGKEITHWFAFENDFATSFHSFITGKAAVENIQFLETTTLVVIAKEKLDELFKRFPETETTVRIGYEKYYIRLEERFVNAQFKSAAERYDNLLRETPHVLTRVPLGYIATYLGITQETLSRIRGRN